MLAVAETEPCAGRSAELRLSQADAACLPSVSDWSDLAAHALEANPFFEHWYLEPALRHLPEDSLWLAHYWVDGVLCGLLPLSHRDAYGRMPAAHIGNWVHYQCFMGTPLIRDGYGEAFWSALIEALDAANWVPGFVSFRLLDADGPVLAALHSAAKKMGRESPIVHCQERALLESDLDADTYLAANVRGKKRKEWRRLENRLAEKGVVAFEALELGAALASWCDDFLALEAAGWKGERGAALANTFATRTFFTEMMQQAAAAGTLEFERLTLDGKPIAMLINFRTPPGSWSYKIAYDESLARFSPGVMIELRNLARVLADPVIDWMDSCAVEDHPMIDHLWAERRRLVQVSVPLSGMKRRAVYAACRAAEGASAFVKGAFR